MAVTSDRDKILYARSFVEQAAQVGAIDAGARARMLWELDARLARLGAPASAGAPDGGGAYDPGASAPSADPPAGAYAGTSVAASVAPPPPPAEPAGARLWSLIASEITVHGLAYLGVLLLFAATL
ncbi:MAG TPA: hypothetical protein VML96_11740, partial [Egibacteraceae bacterium]|nr:hypothetical protein [Egibacteraceae bacterium]